MPTITSITVLEIIDAFNAGLITKDEGRLALGIAPVSQETIQANVEAVLAEPVDVSPETPVEPAPVDAPVS